MTAWWGYRNDRYSAMKMPYMGVVLYRHFLTELATKLTGISK
jgi:hypothetical protein